MLKQISGLIPVLLLLTACKLVNTHTVKVTASAEISPTEVRLVTTKGTIYLAAQNLSQKQRELLHSLRPYQCLNITTAESLSMDNRVARFIDFKLQKVLESDKKCRQITSKRQSRPHLGISVNR